MNMIDQFELGCEVEVSPKMGNPEHEFVGIVIDIDSTNNIISVLDQGDDVFDVDPDQVQLF